MRELSLAELELVAGGNQSTWDSVQLDEIVVTGDRGWDTSSDWYDAGTDGGGWSPGDNTPPPPACNTVNPIVGITAPDGAKYYVPEGVDGAYLLAAINHLRDIPLMSDKINEFNDMYTNPNNPFFIDFKDWGTASGPPGSVSGGTTTYWSDARGEFYTGSVFEAFGNYFYGFAGHLGGIPDEVLNYAAGFTQAGNQWWESYIGMWQDAPEDMPHVAKGMIDAKSYEYNPEGVFSVNVQNCGD